MLLNVHFPDRLSAPFAGVPRFVIPFCLVCETDVRIENLLTFTSPSAIYQLRASHGQLVGHDYFSWASACSGKLCSCTLEGYKDFDWHNIPYMLGINLKLKEIEM